MEENKKQGGIEGIRFHFRITKDEGVKINTLDEKTFAMVKKAAYINGLSLSEFCRMAAMKEARLCLINYRERIHGK